MHAWPQSALYYEVKSLHFRLEKQFDALLVDTSAPVFDTVASDTRIVSKQKSHYPIVYFIYEARPPLTLQGERWSGLTS